MTLGENIVRLRTQKNWSQGDLADALDISHQSVSKWETDASIPELDKLLKLSELFGVTLDELVRGEEVPNTETAMPAAQTVPASCAPQATPEREKRRTIAGTVLLCTGAVILVFCLLLAGDPLTGLLFASPFLICGIICFAVPPVLIFISLIVFTAKFKLHGDLADQVHDHIVTKRASETETNE